MFNRFQQKEEGREKVDRTRRRGILLSHRFIGLLYLIFLSFFIFQKHILMNQSIMVGSMVVDNLVALIITIFNALIQVVKRDA